MMGDRPALPDQILGLDFLVAIAVFAVLYRSCRRAAYKTVEWDEDEAAAH
jgi:hypothetical protein